MAAHSSSLPWKIINDFYRGFQIPTYRHPPFIGPETTDIIHEFYPYFFLNEAPPVVAARVLCARYQNSFVSFTAMERIWKSYRKKKPADFYGNRDPFDGIGSDEFST